LQDQGGSRYLMLGALAYTIRGPAASLFCIGLGSLTICSGRTSPRRGKSQQSSFSGHRKGGDQVHHWHQNTDKTIKKRQRLLLNCNYAIVYHWKFLMSKPNLKLRQGNIACPYPLTGHSLINVNPTYVSSGVTVAATSIPPSSLRPRMTYMTQLPSKKARFCAQTMHAFMPPGGFQCPPCVFCQDGPTIPDTERETRSVGTQGSPCFARQRLCVLRPICRSAGVPGMSSDLHFTWTRVAMVA